MTPEDFSVTDQAPPSTVAAPEATPETTLTTGTQPQPPALVDAAADLLAAIREAAPVAPVRHPRTTLGELREIVGDLDYADLGNLKQDCEALLQFINERWHTGT